MARKRRPRFYFSFRSPFSWIAARVLAERLTPEEQAEIEYIPFWEPDQRTLARLRELGGEFLYTQMSREKHLYILQDIKRMTRSLGYQHVWPIDESPWWELPNLAYLAARRDGKADELRSAVYRARWEEGENIHDMAVIRRVAADIGLDPDRIAGAPEDPEIGEEAAQALLRSYKDGVFGIPFFVLGFERFWGLDRLAPFVAALRGEAYQYLAGGPR